MLFQKPLLIVALFFCQSYWAITYGFSTDASSLEAIDRLILSRETPAHIRENARHSLYWHVRSLDSAIFYPIKCSLPPIRVGAPLTYVPANPSIRKIGDGYLVLCRAVTYKQERGAEYQRIDPVDPKVRTRNFLIKYTKDMQPVWEKEILDDFPRKRYDGYIRGLEDCRLLHDPSEPSKMAMVANVLDANPKGLVRLAYCVLTEDEDAIRIQTFVPLIGPREHLNRWEKNWLPYFRNGQLFAIYSYDPFVRYSIDSATGRCTYDMVYTPGCKCTDFRGSVPPIPFDDGSLCIVHQAIAIAGYGRIYVHRFVFLDENGVISKISSPFTFHHTGVEFSCGMTLDHGEANILIGVGDEDAQACIASIRADVVRAMLHSLPN